ncbi:MAG: hypothetical protein KKA07_16170, partial [Bacteroidetes bacterium]|nr:hypothetical protein [Bacteroidota bacterium]
MKKLFTIILFAFAAQTIQAQGNCMASFTYSLEPDSTVSFTDLSWSMDSGAINITSWNWDFGGNANIQYSNDQNPTGIYFNAYGFYGVSLTITTDSGCSSMVIDTIDYYSGVNPCNISIAAQITPTSGPAVNDGAIYPVVTGGTAPYSYLWTGGGMVLDSTQNLSGLAEGYYTLQVTDASGCTGAATFYVSSGYTTACSASFALSIDSVSGTLYCYDYSSTDSSDMVVTWAWTFQFNGMSQTSSLQNPQFPVNSTGIATVCLSISTANGCSNSSCDTVFLQGFPCALTATYEVTQTSVINGNDGAIDVTVTGGTPPYSYTWNTGDTTQDLTNLHPGYYEVYIYDATYCGAVVLAAYIYEPYDTTGGQIVDTLYTDIVDTCFNFVVDSFYIEQIVVDDVNMTVTVTWGFTGSGMMNTITTVYTFDAAGNTVVYLTINCGSKKALTTYMSYIHISPSMVGTAGTMESAET